MVKLTDGKAGNIAKAEPPAKGQRLIFDQHRDAPRGFALRITAAGGKAFILRYRIDGRERRKTIGQWPTWGLEAAREEARKLLVEIDRGRDPLEEARRRKAELLVKDLAAEWLEKHASGLASEGDIRAYVNNDIIPALGHKKITDVRRRDIIELVEGKAEAAPRGAAVLLIYARRLFEYAANRDLIPANPAAGLKPSAITVKGRRNPLVPKVRSRVLDHSEIRNFWRHVEASGMRKLTALTLKMVLLTGQRPGEVAGMLEEEIDGRWWTIPAARRGKTGDAHTVYLTDTALEVLSAARAERDRLARRRTDPPRQFIFEAVAGSAVTANALARAVRRARAALKAKMDPQWGAWTPHDLRRTMRTGLSACRVRPDIAELAIGHVKRGIVATYDLHGFESERRAALEAWESRLLRIISGQDPDAQGDNVVQLEARP
ncbi:tyrosine-type recombinase/integrase [Rhodovulum sp. YNF3179]|uniref:tyrosine-type recombinase/integrase n=1 Tax=Rhodovulum sp. YNF3179 TaxID=3425127 RepID=UPI003D356308